ncbi:FecR family protein [Salegentibacter maritimus]|uniref:FecR domain-containing protein n=1 Tax=Salegentibacter maritimus TaxID=2794347 RepID=A0ABS0TLM6_9FLAO|nr:FecR family protein [Salegentibacter maritimus]MBI6120888.1 FecR domain-containing protein [Salegentibacter maritimus]
MKENNRFKILFRKYIRDEYSSSELDEFFKLLDKLPENSSVFENEFIENEINKTSQEKLPAQKAKYIFEKVNLKKRSYKKKRQFKIHKIAAVFLALIVGGILISLLEKNNSVVDPNSNYVIIKKANGEREILEDNEDAHILSETGDTIGVKKGNKIEYTRENESLVYNTLYVPNGKKIELSLADGSQIFLNSGSSIRYPLSFSSSDKRRVELEGEAYFKVAKDSLKPFIVNSSDINVQVLGTSFNFNAYKENKDIEVVLVEGLIAMYTEKDQFRGDKTQLLRPGYKGSYSSAGGVVKTAVDTDLYTSWRSGELIYRNKTLEQIFMSLERSFDVKIKNQNNTLSGQIINANFGSESIENIIEYLNNMYEFKYTIKDDVIIIE